MHVHGLFEGLVYVVDMIYDCGYVGVGGVFAFYDLEASAAVVCIVFFKVALRVNIVPYGSD